MLLACFAEKKLYEMLDKWVRQARTFFLRNRRARLGSYFSWTQSSESVTHIELLFLWDGRVPSDTLNVFVSWQLHNISSRHVVVARFYIVYCQSKRCIVCFHFRGSLFCVDFVGLYCSFLTVRHCKHFRCNGSYIPWIVSWTNFRFTFIEFEALLPCGSFDKILRLPNTFLCAPCSIVTRNGLCCWTIRWTSQEILFKQNLNIFFAESSRSIRLVAHAFLF